MVEPPSSDCGETSSPSLAKSLFFCSSATREEEARGRSGSLASLFSTCEVVREEGPEVVVSAPLREAIAARLRDGEQAMVLLNR